MYHRQRWTLEKIAKRLKLIEPLAYAKPKPFPIGKDVNDIEWEEITITIKEKS